MRINGEKCRKSAVEVFNYCHITSNQFIFLCFRTVASLGVRVWELDNLAAV